MNEHIVSEAAAKVKFLRAALKWLEEYGVQIEAGSDGGAVANVGLNFAHSQAGAEQAVHVLSSYAASILPEIINRATADCRHEIDAAINEIRGEVGVATVPASEVKP